MLSKASGSIGTAQQLRKRSWAATMRRITIHYSMPITSRFVSKNATKSLEAYDSFRQNLVLKR